MFQSNNIKMKIFGLILIILGAILICLNIVADFTSPGPGKKETILVVAYYVGFNFLAILGVIFLILGFWMRRRARKQDKKALVDSLFESQQG